jgi:CO/xanthine dehydrogenase FAD-binding subunit
VNPFEYVRPRTASEAVAAASAPGAAYLAGGTNLIDLMKGRIVQPRRLVDVTRLPGMDRIDYLPDGGVRIGALVRNSELAHDAEFSRRFPMIAEAVLSGASAQLRNAATVGGNVLQRTRCVYFYDPASACNKRAPGSGCDARGGETRSAAILGWSAHCIATNPSDFCVPLVALDAVAEIEGRAGRRELPLAAFHRLPGATPEQETVLEPGELIVAVRLPSDAARFAAHARYLSAPRLRSRWYRRRRPCGLRATRSPKHASRWAAWRPSRGARRRRSGRCTVSVPTRARSAWPARRRWPTRRRQATTHSRSSSRGGSWRARSRWPAPVHPSGCRRSPPRRLQPNPE